MKAANKADLLAPLGPSDMVQHVPVHILFSVRL